MKQESFEPNISFLRKVEARQICSAMSSNNKRGSVYITRGGITAIDAHAKAGLIRRPCIAAPGRPSYAELTDAGRTALSASK